MEVSLGQWTPDRTFRNQKMLSEAKNCIPERDGFRPLKAYVAQTDTLATRALGGGVFRRDTSSLTILAGVYQYLYKLVGGTTWTDISDATYTTDNEEGFWKFAQFGDLALMTNGADVIKKYDIVSAPATVSTLGGSPPKAQHIATVRDQVFLGNLENYPNKIRWSGINDAESWTIGVNSSDEQELYEGGQVMNLIGGDVGYIFQERMIRRAVFMPGSPFIYDIQVLDPDRGCIAPRGMCKVGNVAFFLAHDGLFMFSNGQTSPIATEQVEKYFFDNSNSTFLRRTQVGIDPRTKLVFFAYISSSNAAQLASDVICDAILIYHWPTRRWARAEIDVESFLDFVTVSTGLDSLDTANPSIDAMTISLDSLVWNADNISSILGIFGSNHDMGFLQGSNLEAIFELKNVHLFPPQRQFIQVITPYIDSSGVQVAVKQKESIADMTSYGSDTTVEADGRAKNESSARMHDIRVKVPSGSSWTHFQSMDIQAIPEGEE